MCRLWSSHQHILFYFDLYYLQSHTYQIFYFLHLCTEVFVYL